MMAKINVNEFWSALFSSKQRYQTAAQRLGIGLTESVTEEQYTTILNDRINSSRASDKVKLNAKRLLQRLGQLSIEQSALDNAEKTSDISGPTNDAGQAKEELEKEIAQLHLVLEEKDKLLNFFTAKADEKTDQLNALTQTLNDIQQRMQVLKERITKPTWHKRTMNGALNVVDTLLSPLKHSVFVTLALLSVLFFQVHHLTALFNRATTENEGWLSVFGASAIEVTALMLTVHRGDKQTIALFAIFQFLVNICYYFPMPQQVIWVLASGLIAFALWSFSELYVSENN